MSIRAGRDRYHRRHPHSEAQASSDDDTTASGEALAAAKQKMTQSLAARDRLREWEQLSVAERIARCSEAAGIA